MLTNIEQMQKVKSLKDVEIKDKRILIRVDFNVPIDSHHNITDDNRIKEALHTINYCIDHKAKTIVLVTHLGKPKNGYNEDLSLKHIIKRCERLLDKEVTLVEDFLRDRTIIDNAQDGQIFLLENIRFYAGETKNDETLSKQLASLCDVFVNDAFGTSHRAHSSTVGITKFVPTKVAGFLLKREIDAFSKALFKPVEPICLVIGGAKVSSKITLLNNIIPKVNKIIIGGAMSNTFLKALGNNMQNSLIEDEYLEEALKILKTAKEAKVNIYLPVDVVITNDIQHPIDIRIVPVQDLLESFMAVDIGPATVKLFEEAIGLSNTIIWNGPMGIFEIDRFSKGTFRIAHAIADTYAYSIVGGGDTASAANLAGESENISFISTGGGASLELLEGKMLPGFENLEQI
ncbi:MAG: phosphoglycerate kinase [Arcobacteraceae bacterium]|nr:phosphoglycerate kinase [Arcobacteraceae bacterium]MDY0327260.1 phosphoglycerate kinase [Arcobacteraceae bacterium]